MRLSAALLLSLPAAAMASSAPMPAHLLAGRVAGAPMTCVPAFATDNDVQTFRSGDIAYRGRGSTIYLNHPQGCPPLGPNRAIISHSPAGRLCRGDLVDVVDQLTHADYGACPLGDFVPYDRPGK